MLDASNEATDGTILDGQSHVRTRAEAALFVLSLNDKQSIASPHSVLILSHKLDLLQCGGYIYYYLLNINILAIFYKAIFKVTSVA